MTRGGRGSAFIVLALGLIGCSQPTVSPVVQAAPLRGEARDPEFTLAITSPEAVWLADDSIEVQAQLSHIGALPVVTIGSAAGGVIGFSVVEVNGDRRMDAVRDMACFDYTIGPDKPIRTPYIKSGGINPGEANEAFYRNFFDDPLFRLPPGAWHVTAWASLVTGGPELCRGRQVDLHASLLITVQ